MNKVKGPKRLDLRALPPMQERPFHESHVQADTQVIKWTTPEMTAPVEMTGRAALYIHASIDTDDTNFIAKLYNIHPNGRKVPVTSGDLKASHRELDAEQS
jgi:predicted acyl esterase